MKVLVTGASGLLGRGVVRELRASPHPFDVTGVSHSRTGDGLVQCDLTDSAALSSLVERVKPAAVVHCAAERRPDACENNGDQVARLNVSLPAELAQLAVDHHFKLVYISTDYVFPGDAPERGYEPEDEPEPTNAYGQSKLDGERAVIERGFERGAKGVPVLYGQVERNDESAVNVLLDSVREIGKGKAVKMDDWATRYPTNVDDVGHVIAQLLLLDDLPQVLHFSSQQCYTKLGICEMMASLFDPPVDLQSMVPVRDGPKPGETKRPRDCHLSNSKLEQLGIDIREVDFVDFFRREVSRSAQGQ